MANKKHITILLIRNHARPGKYEAVLCVRFYDMYDWLCSLGDGTPEDGAKAYLRMAGMTEEEQ